MEMRQRAEDLARRRGRVSRMGGDFTEIGLHATHAGIAPDLAGRDTPADGVVTGFGTVAGRSTAVTAHDSTVLLSSSIPAPR
jgi:acetyl-CoA carboxylase carboxyltransferase component